MTRSRLFHAAVMTALVGLLAGITATAFHHHADGHHHEGCPICQLDKSLQAINLPSLVIHFPLQIALAYEDGFLLDRPTSQLLSPYFSRAPPGAAPVTGRILEQGRSF